LDPPEQVAISAALKVLTDLAALSPSGELTPLGLHLARLPVDVRVGKMLVLGASVGCLEPCLTIAATMSYRTPFRTSYDNRAQADAARRAIVGQVCSSEFAADVMAYDRWAAARRRGRASASAVARRYCLSEATLYQLEAMRRQFATVLSSAGFDTKERHRPAKTQALDVTALVGGVLCAALWPNVGRVVGESNSRGVRVETKDGDAWIHNSSPLNNVPVGTIVCFHEKVRTGRLILSRVSTVSPITLVLFGGDISVDHAAARVVVGGFFHVAAAARTGSILGGLRRRLDTLLEAQLPTHGAQGRADNVTQQRNDILRAVESLLVDETGVMSPRT